MTSSLNAWCLMVQTVPIVFRDLLGWDLINEAGLTVFYSPVFIWNGGGSLQTIWEVIGLARWLLMCYIEHVGCFSPGHNWKSRPMFDHLEQFSRGRKQTTFQDYGNLLCRPVKWDSKLHQSYTYLLLLLLIWAAVDLSAIALSFENAWSSTYVDMSFCPSQFNSERLPFKV